MSPRHESLYASMVLRGMSRRTFLGFTAAMATTLALPLSYAPRIAAAVTAAPRLPVIWLRGQTCGGNTRALLQASKPTTAQLLLDLVSVEYHETLMARSGASAEDRRYHVSEIAPNGYLAVVEGAVSEADDGVYCTVGGRPFGDIVREVCGGAAATIAVGSCAFDGGAPAAEGGATGSTGVEGLVPAGTLINLPGCPLNVDNLTATIVHYLTFDTMPVTDARHRPLFAYGNLLHNQCERRGHYEFGEFALSWGDEGAQKGWCLYKLGCKGPENFANCPTERFAEGTSWPVRAGHGCIGCTSPRFWDEMGPAYLRLPGPIPFANQVTADQVGLALVGGIAAVTVAHGAASSVRLRRWAAEERRARQAAEAPGDDNSVAVHADVIDAGARVEIESPIEGEVEAPTATDTEAPTLEEPQTATDGTPTATEAATEAATEVAEGDGGVTGASQLPRDASADDSVEPEGGR